MNRNIHNELLMIQTTNQDIYFKIGTKYLLFVTLTEYKT